MPSQVGYSSSSASEVARLNFSRAHESGRDNMQNMASGKRVNSASDNAANIAIAISMTSQQDGTQQAYRNAQEGVAMLQTAESGYQNMTDVLIRMRELAVQSASDTMGVGDRKALDGEFQNLSDELDRMSGAAEFNGIPLMNGQAGTGGAVTFQIDSTGSAMSGVSAMLNAQDTEALGLSGAGVSDQAQAMTSITAIDGAIKQLASDRASIGSSINELGGAAAHLSAQSEATSGALSNVQDANMGSEAMSLSGNSVREQAALAMLLQANQQPDAVLRLLG